MHCQLRYGRLCRVNVALTTMFREYQAMTCATAFRAYEDMIFVARDPHRLHVHQDHFGAARHTTHRTHSVCLPAGIWAARGDELMSPVRRGSLVSLPPRAS